MLVVGTIDLNLIIQRFYHTRIKKAFVGNKGNNYGNNYRRLLFTRGI